MMMFQLTGHMTPLAKATLQIAMKLKAEDIDSPLYSSN